MMDFEVFKKKMTHLTQSLILQKEANATKRLEVASDLKLKYKTHFGPEDQTSNFEQKRI